ncbi:MAG TPA: DUF3311 domain-containing protein [Candidatus Micrarchaeaceae archaeon]|nr:DUF3311 domain-containing protein [Candidatus Micrarchaeaceae archaeon]
MSTGREGFAEPHQSRREGVPQAGDVGKDQPSRFSDAPVAYIISAGLLGSAFVALLWVPSYAHLTPALVGIPFFYWYSLLWLVINSGCQLVAYQLLVAGPRRRRMRATSGTSGTRQPGSQP